MFLTCHGIPQRRSPKYDPQLTETARLHKGRDEGFRFYSEAKTWRDGWPSQRSLILGSACGRHGHGP